MNTNGQILSWTDQGDRRLQAAKAPNGTPLQLTHMVLGNAATPIPATKQATQVRNEVYRAPVDRVALDTAKKSVVCELIVPENQRNQTIREIGLLEHETLMAIGYASSHYTPMQQKDGAWTYIVHIPLENIPASAIETVDNLISLEVSDKHYLNAADNLKDLTNNTTAQNNLGLGSAAVKNAGTSNTDLITTGDADSRFLNASDNLEDLINIVQARQNLGLGTAAVKNVGTGNADLITTGEADSRYLNISKNFSDITDKPAALANLGLQDAATHEYVKTQLATHASSNVSAATEQQAGLVQLATLDEAKAGLAENTALTPAAGAAYLQKDNNLADLANKEKARRYLGLGTAALRDVGILDNQVVTSNQLKDLFTKSFQAGANGYQIFPSGLMMQWGSAKQTASGNVTVIWPNPFPTAVLSVVATPIKSSTLSLSYAVVEITERMAIFCPMIISQTFKIGRVYPVVGSETFSSSSHSVNDEILNSSSYNFNGETFETFNSRHLRSFDSEDSSLDDSFFWQAIGY
ncbi:phage tail protein [Candidatus Regiella insecticola]|uniref:Phage tail-collar fibre protein n=1 Tax=Candidatus Regiella insecticola TaxID=138073 RepID=A0A6L2ZPR7_9ENTR|nr:phage tail protein [Candidatus Regiella insecticola]GFN46365.1 phage tail-collar fibre protein [Candidatus Regiella insecticola]